MSDRSAAERSHCSIGRGVSRREMLTGLAAATGLASLTLSRSWAWAEGTGSSQAFDKLLADLRADPGSVTDSRGYREVAQFFPDKRQERAPLSIKPSTTRVSDRAKDLIIACEVSSAELYEARYRRPTWPGGYSGVTIGVGYDLGYSTQESFSADWKSHIGDSVAKLMPACRKTASAAETIALKLQGVEIPWNTAYQQFIDIELPRYVALAETSLPNFRLLPEDCRGALVSLTYNRGATFTTPPKKDREGRYAEMRNIYTRMSTKDFASIPAEMRSMKRLWVVDPKLRGLLTRRDLEAGLFELGLAAI